MLEGIKRDSLHWGIQIRNSKEAKVAWGMQVKGRQTGDKIRQAKDVGYIIFDILSQYKDCVLYCLWTGKLRSSEQRGLVSTVQLLSYVLLFATPWTAARQASLSFTNSQSLSKHMSIELVMPCNHLILCHPLLLLPSIFSSIRVFSSESAHHLRWPKYWSSSFSISPSNE